MASLSEGRFIQTEINKACDRRHSCHDPDKLPYHEFGIYSIAEQIKKQRPLVLKNSPSPPPPILKPNKRPSDTLSPVRPQNSRIKEGYQ